MYGGVYLISLISGYNPLLTAPESGKILLDRDLS
jgi:hypothetical protein